MELNQKSVTKETWRIRECVQTKEHNPKESIKQGKTKLESFFDIDEK